MRNEGCQWGKSQSIWWGRLRGLGVAAVASLLLASCGSSNGTRPDAAAAGGAAAGSGGTTATGGAAAGSGGGTATGGAAAGSGGALVGTGGGTAAGGAPGTGGATTGAGGGAGAGGAVASGGAGGGQGGAAMATGGQSGGGGALGTGGAPSGGADGGIDAPADAGAGDTATDVAPSDSMSTTSGAVDIVFLVDDSYSMQPLQAKLAQAFSGFMNTLEALPGGLPSVHIAVVSSSLGAGAFSNVSGCMPATEGNKGGAFLHPAACTGLPASERFLIADGPAKNFTGDISDVFGCLAMIGATGCGFEHQFEATRRALLKAQTPGDPDNAGFLRPNAHLAIIMLTNEDDCSAPVDSTLFDPNQQTTADPVGGLQSYRCNEFGHLCDGVAPPHLPPATPLSLTNCVPAEAQGRLTLVSDFIAFLRNVKSAPGKVFVAAMAGPVTPYVVHSQMFMLGSGATEVQPVVQHSCSNPTGTYADPAVRIKTVVDAFGATGIFESLCPDDLGPPMMRIAQALANAIR